MALLPQAEYEIVCHFAKLRGIPPDPDLFRRSVIARLRRDVFYSHEKEPPASTWSYVKRKRAFVNETGLTYHRRFKRPSWEIEVISFFRIPDTRNMRYVVELAKDEQELIEAALHPPAGVKFNFKLTWDEYEKRNTIPREFR